MEKKSQYPSIFAFNLWVRILLGLVLFTRVGQTIEPQRETISPTAARIWDHLSFLGHDSLQGRGTGTWGGWQTARYLADQLEKYGLKPVGDNGSFFQAIPMHGSMPLAGSELIYYSPDGSENLLHLNADYLLYKTGPQTFIPTPVPLVFVGYGIIAPEYDYNDYQAIDVQGKIAVYLSGEPASDDPDYFNGNDPTIYAYPESKQRLAISRGARGSILIPNPRQDLDQNWAFWQREFESEDVSLAYTVSSHFSAVVRLQTAAVFFANASASLEQVLNMDRLNSMHSFSLTGALSFRGQFRDRNFLAHNVVGLIPGSDSTLAERTVLVSAHYDHLGTGRTVDGDSIYNGVADNAAGVAAALEIARTFAAQTPSTRRSVLFLFLTGEEKGALGSQYYVDHPIMPLYLTVTNVNIDGLAMFDRFREVVGVGAELSTLENALRQTAENLNLQTASIPPEFLRTESFARSDQISFAKAGIPSILIMDGLSYENLSTEEGKEKLLYWMQNIYHSPRDDLNQPMDLCAMQQHAQFLSEFIGFLADAEDEPQWYPGVPFINSRLQTIAEKR
ncbi:M20/M25/M40 family metallo-hydrolase [candidate division KSB1 bacterium]|nr:M20/M25/M40 family metallo-hydrolase [candidate division KSB1 bacterium]